MQQHLMQMQQPTMGAYAYPNQVTTELIQQYLDENKQLILTILDSQNSGRAQECAEHQAKLQRNLMYLAAIADRQPPPYAQFGPNAVIQTVPQYMQHQQSQQMTPPSLLAARSSMAYAQSPMFGLQQQQAAAHGHLVMSSGGSSGYSTLHGEASMGGNGGVFTDYGRNSVGKQDAETAMMAEGRGGNTGGESGEGQDPLYLKGSEEEGS